MNFETSLSIDPLIKLDIINASKSLNCSSNYIIKLLIKKTINNCDYSLITKTLTKYQIRRNNADMSKFRYRIDETERQIFSLARHKLCHSISLILLIGYLLYFKKILNKKFKKRYSWNSYTIIRLYFFNIIDFVPFKENIRKKSKNKRE